MDNHKLLILASCSYGYVGKCPCCEKYNMVFNNQLFVFPEEDLRQFRRILDDGDTVFNAGDLCCNGRNIGLKTPVSNFYLMFTPREFEHLRIMLDDAFVMIEVNKVLQY
ncbi:DUF6686 family protein [Emticicia sp. TH156]|uniref:DUF6686 family protein n=1 Tax=Emticicia sp. TH156 TaxID=2067454 RepID=UPI000C759E4D|nr:DUF6686 family protein [Emticicia sp. TH156]PLK43717.1 hypothetical protein C0V77_14480 [Emticicia sp. TH156]